MENMYIITSSGELHHHGIPKMQWGRRRYQNKDGSLTPEGKKRYAKVTGKINKLEAQKRALEGQKVKKNDDEETVEQKKARILDSHDPKLIYKNKDLFSDREIQDAYLRLNNERNIKNLIPEEVSRGKQILNKYTDASKTIKSVVDSSNDLYNSYVKAEKLIKNIAGRIDKSRN